MSLGFLQHMVDLCEQVTESNYEFTHLESDFDQLRPNQYFNKFLHSLPRHFSAEQYHDVVEFIIGKGLGSVFRDGNKDGITPLHYALGRMELLPQTLDLLTGRSNCQDEENICYLDLNAADKNGNTILHWAVEGKRSLEFFKYMLNLGESKQGYLRHELNIAKQNRAGNTFLHLVHPYYYTPSEYHQIVELLTEKGQGNLFSVANVDGLTPFHLAVYKLELLPKTLDLLAGSPIVRDQQEVTPPQRLSYNNRSFVELSSVDKHGNGVIHWAVKGSRTLAFLQHLVTLHQDWHLIQDGSSFQQLPFGNVNTFIHHLCICYSPEQYHEIAEFFAKVGMVPSHQ